MIGKIGRNDLCFCGSGKKYKKCCLGKEIPEEFKRKSRDILPDRWLIDYGKPCLDKNFFERHKLADISAAKMVHMGMVCPEMLEDVAADVRQETARHLEQVPEITALAGPQEIIHFLKRRPDRLNYQLVLEKFIEHEEETVELILEELKTSDDEFFVEWSVKLLYESDLDFVAEILEIIKSHQHNAYTVSMLCVLLGFYHDPKIPKVLWDCFHYFRAHFPEETYHEGPLLALYELRDDFESELDPEISEDARWDEKKLAAFDDQEILDRMRGLGIPMDREAFWEDIQGYHSAEKLVDFWLEKYSVVPAGFDEDFLWFAAMELWQRWAPDTMFDERLSDMVERGYDLQKEKKDREGCDVWLSVWEYFKTRYTGHVVSVEEADKEYKGAQSWYNWCQDFEMLLGNVVRQDCVYGVRAAAYFREFCDLLPESNPLIIQNMMMAHADVLFLCDDAAAGERMFREVVEKYPKDVWGYIRWGDIYAPKMNLGADESDPEKAERIYRMALDRGLKEEKEVRQRIKDLHENTKRVRKGD